MKKNYFFLAGLVGVSFLLSFSWDNSNELQAYYKQSHRNAAGSPAGRTGAPGELNCTACHSGTVQSGAGINTVTIADGNGAVTEYIPGTTYTVTIDMGVSNPKNGFQIISLNSSNAQAGTNTIISGSGTQQLNGSSGKKYITHTSSGNSLSTWSYEWTAPATNVGDITFYLATNQSNSNSNNTGDLIRVSNFTIGSTVSVDEEASSAVDVSLGFNALAHSLNIQMQSAVTGKASMNIVDMSGKSVQFEELGEVSNGKNGFSVLLNHKIQAGTYIAHISVNNHFVTKKFVIN